VSGIDVGTLVDDLGPALVTATTGDLSRLVTGLVTTDPAFPAEVPDGALVLAVGFEAETDAWQLLCEVIQPYAAAVAVKAESPVAATGLCVIAVNPKAEWTQLTSLMHTSTSLRTPLDNTSLFDAADAVAALCGGPVVLHDASWDLLAYSSDQPNEHIRNETILGRRAPRDEVARLRITGVVARLQAGEVVHINPEEMPALGQRWAVGVRVGTEFLGSIWLIPDPNAAESEVREGLKRSAEIAALSFLRHATLETNTEQERDAALESLLRGGHTDRIVADGLGVDGSTGFFLAGLRPLTTDGAERTAGSRRLRAVTRSYLEAYRVTSAIACVGDTLYVLLACPDSASRDSVGRILTDLHTRVQESVPHRAVVSARYDGISETPTVRQAVDDLHALAQRRGWTGIFDSESVQSAWRLEQLREAALTFPTLLDGPIKRLVDYDREHAGDLVDTLRSWFECVGDTRLCAERMGLHNNTVRYRIRRVEEVAGVSLVDADDRLLLEMQVRLLRS
jgi:hypothetical protein